MIKNVKMRVAVKRNSSHLRVSMKWLSSLSWRPQNCVALSAELSTGSRWVHVYAHWSEIFGLWCCHKYRKKLLLKKTSRIDWKSVSIFCCPECFNFFPPLMNLPFVCLGHLVICHKKKRFQEQICWSVYVTLWWKHVLKSKSDKKKDQRSKCSNLGAVVRNLLGAKCKNTMLK